MKKSQPSEDLLIQSEASDFLNQFKSLILATVSENQQPDSSTAPFLRDNNGDIYVYLSELAQHTRNLLVNPSASLMVLADEASSKNLFARKRLTMQVSATEIPRNSPQYEFIMDAMQSHLGNTLDVLRALPDFHLFQFQIDHANYVQGFAKAYALKGSELELVEHRQS